MIIRMDQENICGGEDGSAGGGGVKELDPSQERRRCARVRFMKQVFLASCSFIVSLVSWFLKNLGT